MKLIKASDCEYYEAKKHFNCWTGHKVTPGETSKRLNIGYSHFLPNGGAEMSASPLERIYYLLTGSMAVKDKNEEEFIMQPGDMVYIAPDEERSVRILGPEIATILVIMSRVD
jgi:quercetin dioxygenase-like cupin family protein